jgi:rhodanese-related sulfurtransferase
MTAVVLSFGLSQIFAQALAQDAPMQIEGAKTLDSKGVIELISTTPDVVIIDNRTKADFDSGHIEGAVNIVDTGMIAESAFAGVVKSKTVPVLFYCNGVKCGRAAKATAKAVAWGYSRVYYYALGIPDWKANQFPLVTP